MGPQQERIPRQELQAVYDAAVKMLRQWDPDRLRGRDPAIVRALERVKTRFGLKDPP
jgi:hypothetical protein